MIKTTTTTIKDFFSSNQGDRIVKRNINCISVLPFNQITDDELASDLHNEKINTNNNVQDQIDKLENMIMIEDQNDGTILSDIDPDLNILYNMNDAINSSSRYYDSYLFRSTFHFCKTQFSILKANIRGMVTNLDNFKFFLDDLNNNFPIIGVTENWLKPHNVDSYFIEGYTHEYDLRPKRPGGGVSLFIADSLTYTRRNDIYFNSVFNSITIDIDKCELDAIRNVSVIIVYRPPNTDSSLFINELDIILTMLKSENRDIFLIGDFNYDTFKSRLYQSKNIEPENFTNILSEFNLYKLIHKPTRIKPPSATLLDNIYTNIPINIDSCKSGILTSNISDHFFVFGVFDILKINNDQNYYKVRNYSEKYIQKFVKVWTNKSWDNLVSFTIFYNYFLNYFLNIFPEKNIKIKYKNRHSWMPTSLLNSI